jgi:hypothetical protein
VFALQNRYGARLLILNDIWRLSRSPPLSPWPFVQFPPQVPSLRNIATALNTSKLRQQRGYRLPRTVHSCNTIATSWTLDPYIAPTLAPALFLPSIALSNLQLQSRTYLDNLSTIGPTTINEIWKHLRRPENHARYLHIYFGTLRVANRYAIDRPKR